MLTTRTIRGTTMNRRSILFAGAVAAVIGVLGPALTPQPAHAKGPPRQIVGTWRISNATGGVDGEYGIMRIGPTGHMLIALTGRLAAAATPASVPPDEAARLYRGTVILQGYCHPVLKAGSYTELAPACDVVVEEGSVPGLARKEFRLAFKITDENPDGLWFLESRSGADAPFELNRSWVLVESQ
jgi:hypothetical protein